MAATHRVCLGFTPPSMAVPDPDHPGLLRAGSRVAAPYGEGSVETHRCAARDLCAEVTDPPGLLGAGFDTVDLSGLDELQSTCADVRVAGRITETQAAAVRGALGGALLPTSSGALLRVLHLVDEGFIMRTSGPNRLPVVGPRSVGMNDHGGATSVHVDQDVYGTPMTQLMGGRAPELFVHDSPDGSNHEAAMLLVNLWIPLQQITQPLVLADGRSVDRSRHQLRYGLATDSFLERDEDQVINDIWTFLHDDAQQWYLRSEMDHRRAYVFNTLSTPHGCGVLPGEDVAEWCYRTLAAAESAARRGDTAGLLDAIAAAGRPALTEPVPPALQEAVEAMLVLLGEAAGSAEDVCGARAHQWSASAYEARRRVVRMSLEMRMVVAVEGDPGAAARSR